MYTRQDFVHLLRIIYTFHIFVVPNCNIILLSLRRSQDDHQRLVALLPSISRGHDLDHILSNGVRPVRASSIHGRVAEQMRHDQQRQRELAVVSFCRSFINIILY